MLLIALIQSQWDRIIAIVAIAPIKAIAPSSIVTAAPDVCWPEPVLGSAFSADPPPPPLPEEPVEPDGASFGSELAE